MKYLNLKKIVVLLLPLISITACSSSISNPNRQSTELDSINYEIQLEQNNASSLYGVQLTKDSIGTIISGKLRPKLSREHARGHIDVSVVSASGEMIAKSSAKIDKHISHRHHKSNHPHFQIYLKEKIPAGAKVLVSFHSNTEAYTGKTGCKNLHCL